MHPREGYLGFTSVLAYGVGKVTDLGTSQHGADNLGSLSNKTIGIVIRIYVVLNYT